MKKKAILLLLTLALGVGVLGGCGNSTSSDKGGTEEKGSESAQEASLSESTIPEDGLTVRVAELDMWIVAQEKGFLEEEFGEENVNFEFTSFQGGAYINEAMAADSVDIGAMWEQPALTAVANDYPETIIATYGYSDSNAPLITTTESGITSLEDFKGKNAKIGVILGGSFHYTALKYLEQVGLTENDVELLNASDVQTMLRSGDIDAAVTFASYAQPLIEDGTCRQVAIGTDYGLMAVYTIVANNKFLEEHPDVTVRILKVLDKAINYVNENPEEAMQLVADYLQQDYETNLANYQSSVYKLDVTQEDLDAMAQVEQFLEDYKLIQKHVIGRAHV